MTPGDERNDCCGCRCVHHLSAGVFGYGKEGSVFALVNVVLECAQRAINHCLGDTEVSIVHDVFDTFMAQLIAILKQVGMDVERREQHHRNKNREQHPCRELYLV